MILSIRKRMLINIVFLAVPMSFFAWQLTQQVQTLEIDFAEQEIKGLALQKPLTRLLHEVHQHKLALLRGQQTASIDARIAQERAALTSGFSDVGSDIGFNDLALSEGNLAAIGLPVAPKQWKAVAGSADKALASLPSQADAESLAAHTALAGALKSMITRASDGSNLTLDPDLDSYYVMDALSFAIPNAIDNLGNAESDAMAMTSKRTISPDDVAKIEVWKHILSSDDSGRVIGSLGTALAEDANFHGVSASLAQLKPLMDSYQEKNNAVLALLDRVRTPGSMPTDEEISVEFQQARGALMALHQAAQEEMKILLSTRIGHSTSRLNQLLLEGGSALLVGLLLFWVVSRSIVNPINELRNVMNTLAKGRLDITIPHTAKRDEIGQMATAVVIFKQNAEHLHKLSCDFENSVKQAVEIVASAATEMNATSCDLGHRASSSYKKLTDLDQEVVEVSESIQHVSTAGSQLSSAISEISAQVHKSTATTNTAVIEASNVKRVAESMAYSAQKVSGIVEIINGIAAKISLLSLNATIEAARAGEAGKGFAVVASEVKTLATQTASATSEITTLVEAMQESSNATLGAISEITTVIEQINTISGIIAAAIEEQGAATRDIASHIHQASSRVEVITKNISEVAESTGHSTAAATQAVHASQELSQQSEKLRTEVNNFLRNMAAA